MTPEEGLAHLGIRDTLMRYNIAGDGNKQKDFLAVFTDDAIFEASVFRIESKAEIEAYFGKRSYAKSDKGPKFRRHNLTTSQIDLTGPTTANVRTYYQVWTDIGPDHCGYYVDKFRLEKGRWLIAHRGVWVDWASPNSVFVPQSCKTMIEEKGTCGPLAAMEAGEY